MANLQLSLKKKYFLEIKDGSKILEYRLQTPYWEKRLEGRDYDKLILTLGYPKKTDKEKRIELKYRGYSKMTIVHPEWGDFPVDVYAIYLS